MNNKFQITSNNNENNIKERNNSNYKNYNFQNKYENKEIRNDNNNNNHERNNNNERENDSDSDISSKHFKWLPNSNICIINRNLILKQSNNQSNNNNNNLSQIEILDLHLRDGKIGKIRKIENLNELINLKQLNLSFNAITKIEGLNNLLQLVELNLAENSISKIEGIFHLRSLERLSLCGNQIERIPPNISELHSLTRLRLNRNKLHIIEDLRYLSSLQSLQELRVDKNPFTEPTNERSNEFIRIQCLSYLPNVILLNTIEVTQIERNQVVTNVSHTNLSQLKQQLQAAQRRAEILDAESREIKKQHNQLTHLSHQGNLGEKEITSLQSKLELLSRLRIEKSNEVIYLLIYLYIYYLNDLFIDIFRQQKQNLVYLNYNKNLLIVRLI